MATQPNYFTCTLGQAASLGLTQPHKTVNAFLDAQAKNHPDLPAVGFAVPEKDQPWTYRLYTFAEVHRGSCNLATHILAQYPELKTGRRTFGLLCPSTPEFLFLWLALMRAGCAVLLIAPQCSAVAIKALYEQCETAVLFHDDVYADQAQEAVELAESHGGMIKTEKLPLNDDDHLEQLIRQDIGDVYEPQPPVQKTDVAYLHHTSGTSSGIPKPVPQPHNAAVGVQPAFPDGRNAATFTTTPLFHGGIADLFRAWTSSAPIWLFPGKSVPITSANILKCLDVARQAAKASRAVAPVKYFSSVPYVLQMLDADPSGLEALKSMSMVGVGGAALPAEVGDRLVSKGVNLLSRYGSAECGFLMSSQRDFASDREWQYLRFPSDATHLRLEEQGDGLSELIVLDGWPHMAKRNRDDGSYATSDLFAPHEKIAGAWKYHSRSDSQLTLITGKKFDPAPLEAAIGTSELIEDALVFGNGEAFPGVLLFRSRAAKGFGDDEVLRRVWPAVERLNRESPDHARLGRGMVKVMGLLEEGLEKSSKGTLMRGAAEKRFQSEIEAAYHPDESNGSTDEVADENLERTVHEIVEGVVHRKRHLDVDVDLFSYGVDSVAGMQIRSRLQRLLPADSEKLPMTIVEDCGTVASLARFILKRRRGETDVEANSADDHAQMRQLVEQLSDFTTIPSSSKPAANGLTNGISHQQGEVLLLTGATGALGAHILHQTRQLPANKLRKIYCLVRGASPHAARERVDKALAQRKLPPLSSASEVEVEILQSELSDPQLGLDKPTYDRLAREVTATLHLAWSVNFRMRLHSFVRENLAGLRHLLDLALASSHPRGGGGRPRFGFCSSVAAVGAYAGEWGEIPEALADDPGAATEKGYSRSKWVAEQVCARSPLADCTTIFRVGQLAGDTENGVWNASEAYPLMLKSMLATGSLPDLGEGEVVNWLPVDIAAKALVEGMNLGSKHGSEDMADEPTAGEGKEGVRVLHILNPHVEPSWADLRRWLRKTERFEAVEPREWVKRLEELGEREPGHPALRLLEHWRVAYAGGEGQGVDGDGGGGGGAKPFAVERTEALVPTMRNVEPVSEEYFAKLWAWIKGEM